jgi:hypothetical protein
MDNSKTLVVCLSEIILESPLWLRSDVVDPKNEVIPRYCSVPGKSQTIDHVINHKPHTRDIPFTLSIVLYTDW